MQKMDIIESVNWGILLLVVGVGLVASLFAMVWPYLHPESPFWAQQRLVELLRTWERVRDLNATVIIRRPGEPPLRVRLFYLAGAAARLEVEEPSELAGEVYTLRPAEEDWIFVHFRPRLSLGLEARFSPAEVEALFAPFALGKGEVRWVNEVSFVLRGLTGPFRDAEVHVGGEFSLPQRIILREPQGHFMELQVIALEVNQGMELRDLLILDPFPTRWIRIPTLSAPGA